MMTNSTLIDDPDFAPGRPPKAKGVNPLIQAELVDGEKLVWVGQPRLNPSAGALPAGVLFCCLVIGGFVGLLGCALVLVGLFDQPSVMGGPLIVGCFLGMVSLVILWVGFHDLIGLFPAVTDPLRAWYRRQDRETHYALTDRRVILWEPAWFGRVVQVRSIRANELSGMKRLQREDGSGVLFLENMARLPSEQTGLVTLAHLRGIGEQTGLVTLAHLRGIDDVRHVEALIRATLFAD